MRWAPAQRWRSLAVLLACCAVPCCESRAQLAELQPGARVRLRVPGAIAGRLEGIIIARTVDSVTVATPRGGLLPIPLVGITFAQVSRGRRRLDGALKGGAWGTGIGLALGVLTMSNDARCTDAERECREELSRGEYLGTGLLSGALIGVAVGAIVRAEHWERLTLPARAAVRPTSHGTGLAFTLAF